MGRFNTPNFTDAGIELLVRNSNNGGNLYLLGDCYQVGDLLTCLDTEERFANFRARCAGRVCFERI